MHELTLTRTLRAPPKVVFRCWTEPALMVQWFTPPPWKTVRAEVDVRVGGASLVVMQSPAGEDVPHRGVYLHVEPGRRLVTTDAYVSAWVPSEKPFMTLDLTFDDGGNGMTLYRAVARHWTAEDRAAHEAMGFHQGWGIATDQLDAIAQTLAA